MALFQNWLKKGIVNRLNLIRVELLFVAAFTFLLSFLLDYASTIKFNAEIAFVIGFSLLLLIVASFIKFFQNINIRLFSYTSYLAGVLYTLYIAHTNNYNLESFFLIFFVYGFYAITLANLKLYFKFNIIIVLTLLVSISILRFETEVSWIIIFLSFLFLNLLGKSTSLTREYLKRKIKERDIIMKHVFNNSKVGMLLVESDEEIIFEANETAAKSLGFKYGRELNGLTTNDLKIKGKKIFNLKEKENKKSIEFDDGRIFTIYRKEADYNDKKFKLIEFSEYKNLEELNFSEEFKKLKISSEESYENLFKQSASLICIISKKGKILDVSDRFQELLGYDREEIIDEKANSLDYINYEKERKIFNEKAWNGEEQVFEKSIVSKSGKIIHIEVILKRGKYFGEDVFISNSRDITKRKELEKEVSRKTNEYDNLLEYSPISILINDEDGKIIDFNPAFSIFFGIKKDNKQTYNLKDFIVEKDIKEYLEQLQLLKSKEDFAIEMQIEYKVDSYQRKFGLLKTIKQNTTEEKSAIFITQIVDISDRFEYEMKLEKGRKKYKDLIDNSIIGIAILKEEEVVFVNKKALEILKIDDEKRILGKKRSDFVKEKDKDDLSDHFIDLKNRKNTPLREFTINNPDGESISVEIKLTLIEYEGDECTLISFIDIQDRKEVEFAQKKIKETTSVNESLQLQLEQNRLIQKRLQNAQSYSAGVIESSMDMIFTTDVSGALISLNSAAKTKLNLEELDFKNKKFGILFKEKLIEKEILKQLTLKKAYSGEVEMIKKDGSAFIAFLSISYLFNTDGAFLGMMGISRNISEIKEKEHEIKAQASKLASIIESSSHYFFTINRELLITSFNKLFELDVKENIGAKVSLFDKFNKLYKEGVVISANEVEKFWEKKFDEVFKGKSTKFEIERKSIKGDIFYREIFLNPIYSENGEINEVSGIGHDTTEKRLYEKELKKSLGEKEVLLKEVHHRVKNNMQVISSILNLQSAYVEDKYIISVLNESQNRIRAMASIHERLYRTNNFSDIKFSSYIEDLAENLINTYELSDSKIDLSCDVEEVFLTLNMSIPCGLIINELISNSLKYAFKGIDKGKIMLSLKVNGEELELVVQDNGVGVPKDMDIEQTDTLGLQLVSTLVEQIEGKITLDRTKGSKFVILFKSKNEE